MAEPTDTQPPRTADGTPVWTPVTEHNGITFTQQQQPPPPPTTPLAGAPSVAATPSATPPPADGQQPPQQSGQPKLPIDPTQGSPTGSANTDVPVPPLSLPPVDPTRLGAGGTLSADGLKNGDYSLRMVDGNLVLSGPDGRIWESATNGAGGSLTFRADGSFDISVSGPYGGYSIWQNGLKLDNVGDLQLTDKGKLVILDKNGKEIHTIAAADGVKHYAVVSLHIPVGAPFWLVSLIDAIDAWFQKGYDLLGAGKPGETDELFKMMTNQGLLDPRKERNTGKLVEQYVTKGDSIVAVKNQLRQGNSQVQVLSLNQIPEKIGETRIKLDRIVAELNDKLRHVDPEAVVTGKEMKPAAAAAAVDALYHAVGRAEKELKSATDFIAETREKVNSNAPGSNQVGASGKDAGGTPPLSDSGGAPTPGQDMTPLFADLLSGSDSVEQKPPGGIDIDALLKDLDTESTPPNPPAANGGTPASAPASNPLAGLMGLMPLLPMMAQMMHQLRPQTPEPRRTPDHVDPDQPDPHGPGSVPPGASPPVTYTDAPATAAPVSTPPPPPSGRKTWVTMNVGNVQQDVPKAVALAVNKEFNDPNGIDARDAYAETSGRETEDKRWHQVDSSSVQTGDVVKWTNTTTGEPLTGIVVVNGSDMQLVTYNKLIALDLQNPPAAGGGPYEFAGFFHPSGVDDNDMPTDKPPAPPAINTATPPTPAPPAAPAAPPPPPRT